jgi:hypothetical protein
LPCAAEPIDEASRQSRQRQCPEKHQHQHLKGAHLLLRRRCGCRRGGHGRCFGVRRRARVLRRGCFRRRVGRIHPRRFGRARQSRWWSKYAVVRRGRARRRIVFHVGSGRCVGRRPSRRGNGDVLFGPPRRGQFSVGVRRRKRRRRFIALRGRGNVCRCIGLCGLFA